MANRAGWSHSSAEKPILIERHSEQAFLQRQLERTVMGQGCLVLVGGEAGIGKTALVAWLAEHAEEAGADVLWGHAYDLSVTPPYGPWLEIARRIPNAGELPSVAALLAPPKMPISLSSQERLFAEVVRFFNEAASSKPLVLVLEDMHWADQASLALLRYLAREVAGKRLLLLVTYRSDELTHQHRLYQLLPRLVREAAAERLTLRPLDATGHRAFVEARYGLAGADAERLAGYLQDRAEGNPLFAVELLRMLEEEGVLGREADGWSLGELSGLPVPSLLRQLIEGRAARVGDEGARLLAAGAVIGQVIPLNLWHAAAQVDEDALLGLVDRAVEASLLVEAPDGLSAYFVHALQRDALYESLPPTRRRFWHLRVAEALLGFGDPEPNLVAHHLLRAGDERSIEWLIRAGERAQGVYAWLTASERFSSAVERMGSAPDWSARRAQLQFRVAMLRRLVDPEDALKRLEDAAQLAAHRGDRVLAAQTLFFRGHTRCILGGFLTGLVDMESGVTALDALRGDWKPLGQAEGVVVLGDAQNHRGTLSYWLAQAGRFEEARSLAEKVVSEARPPSSGLAVGDSYATAWTAHAEVQAACGRPSDARAAYARAREHYRAIDHHYMITLALQRELTRVILPYDTENLTARTTLAAQSQASQARAAGALGERSPLVGGLLPLLLLEGRWSEARSQALQITTPQADIRDLIRTTLAFLDREQGFPDEAWVRIREGLPLGLATMPGAVAFLPAQELQRLASLLALDEGNTAAAQEWLTAHDRWQSWSGAALGRPEGELGWSAFHRAAGHVSQAREHAGRALAAGSQPRRPLVLLEAHRLLGELDTETGRLPSAARHLGVAIELAVACAAPFPQAECLFALADLRRAESAFDLARDARDRARELCRAIGATRVLERHAAREEPRGQRPARPDGLTAREIEILRLVAYGRSNRAIAEALSLSVRTVERHISNVYLKIGAHNRADATAYAFRRQVI